MSSEQGWVVEWPDDPEAYITHVEAFAYNKIHTIGKLHFHFKDKPYPLIVPLYLNDNMFTESCGYYLLPGTIIYPGVSHVKIYNVLNTENNVVYTSGIEVFHINKFSEETSYILDNSRNITFSKGRESSLLAPSDPKPGTYLSSLTFRYGSTVTNYEIINSKQKVVEVLPIRNFFNTEQTVAWPDDANTYITRVEAFAYEDNHAISKLRLYFKDKPEPVVVSLPADLGPPRPEYLLPGARDLPGVTSITFYNYLNSKDNKVYTNAIQVIQATQIGRRTSYFLDNRGKMGFSPTTPRFSSTVLNPIPGTFVSSVTFKYKDASAFEVTNTKLVKTSMPVTVFVPTTPQVSATPLPTFVDSNWSPWSEWSECNPQTKTKMRTRVCNAASCIGDSREDLICPYDGVFDEWSDWTTCMLPTGKTCGDGRQMRGRSYTPAMGGGKELTGPTIEYKDCYTPCPVDGNFSEWSSWSDCLSHRDNCGEGEQKRTRTYTPAKEGGKEIEGPLEETMPCFTPCPIDGEFAPWSEWSPCVEGEQTRTRTYVPPQNGGKEKEGPLKETQKCTSIVNSLLNLIGLGTTESVTQSTVQTSTQQTSSQQTSTQQTSASQTSSQQTSTQQTPTQQTGVTQQSNTSTLPIKDPTDDPLFTFSFREHWWILLLILIFIILVVIGIAKSGKKKADQVVDSVVNRTVEQASA